MDPARRNLHPRRTCPSLPRWFWPRFPPLNWRDRSHLQPKVIMGGSEWTVVPEKLGFPPTCGGRGRLFWSSFGFKQGEESPSFPGEAARREVFSYFFVPGLTGTQSLGESQQTAPCVLMRAGVPAAGVHVRGWVSVCVCRGPRSLRHILWGQAAGAQIPAPLRQVTTSLGLNFLIC